MPSGGRWTCPSLVDRVLAGHGTPGTSLLPPFQANWYVPPAADAQRSFDLQTADEKLIAAGYVKDASGARLDKEGKPIIAADDVAGLRIGAGDRRPVHHRMVGRTRDPGRRPA